MPPRLSLSLSLVLAFACALLTSCEREPVDGTARITGATMGTTYELKLVPADPKQPLETEQIKKITAQAEELLVRINQQMSTYDPNSELSRFNSNPSTDWIAVSPELYTVVAEGRRISELTQGAYDITVGPLVNLWGFGPDPRHDQAPSDAAILQARDRVGYWHLQLNPSPPLLKKDRPDLYVDLSSLAKGYAVDRLAELLEANGIQNYLVAIAGDLRAKGHNGHGQLWTVAIEQPTPEQRAVQRLIQISDRSVSTAGDYRNYFEQNGRRYSHIIDPRTGRPVLQTLASVTVISRLSMEADVIDTALMAAGAEEGFQLATEHDLAAFFIFTNPDGKGFQERYTPAFTPFLATEKP